MVKVPEPLSSTFAFGVSAIPSLYSVIFASLAPTAMD